MENHRRAGWLLAWLATVIVIASCAAGTTTPTPTASPLPSSAVPSSAVATSTPTVVASASPAPTATPTPSLDPALVGTWTGTVETPFKIYGPIPIWAATHTISPCAIGEACGTWEWRGRITEVDAKVPWAIVGDEVICRGWLSFNNILNGVFVFWAQQTSFEAAGGKGCGDVFHRMTLEADDTIHLAYGESMTGSKRGDGTLHRLDASPAPTASR